MASDYFLEKSLKSLAVKSKSSLSQIKYKHRVFMTKHPSGVVKRKDIIDIFSQILPQKYSENLCDLVLTLFGNRNRNEIDFEKTVMADMTIRKWTIEEKLIWFFNIFDRFLFIFVEIKSSLTNEYFRKRVGFISLAEVIEIFSTIYILEDEETEKALEKATQVFYDLDTEGDQEISREEFIAMCRQDNGIIQTLKETHEWI